MSDERKYEVLPGVELPDMKSINAAASDFSVSGVSDIQIKSPKPSYTSEGKAADMATAEELAMLQSLGDQVAADEARAAAESRRRMDNILANAVQKPESIVDLLNYNRDKVSEERIKEKEEELKKAEEIKKAAEEKERQREERRQLQQRLLMEARERAAAMREAEKRGIKANESLIENNEGESEAENESKNETETKPKAEPEVAPVKETESEPEMSFADPDKVFASAPAKIESEKPAPEPVKEPEKQQEMPAPKKPEKKIEEPVKPSIASAEETFDDFSEFLDGNK